MEKQPYREELNPEYLKVIKRITERDEEGYAKYTRQEIVNDLGISFKRIRALEAIAYRENYAVLKVFDNPSGVIDEKLSDKLHKRFPKYREVLVVRTPASIRNIKGNGDPDAARRRKSDSIHKCLGNVAGDHLWRFIRDLDHIGVGSGRGCYYVCHYLSELSREREQKRPRRLKIKSLTGVAGVKAWIENQVEMDAYDSAQRLSGICDSVRLYLTGHSVLAPKEVDLEQYMESDVPYLSLNEWKKNESAVPDLAILGVGTLVPGHRFLEAKQLKLVRAELDQLREYINEYTERLGIENCPIADIGNNLFIAADDTPEYIDKIVHNINSRLICVKDEHLEMVKSIFIVAGGLEKVSALRALHKKPFLAKSRCTLYTDSECAEAMLRLEEGAKNR